jgi:hypothetical protein
MFFKVEDMVLNKGFNELEKKRQEHHIKCHNKYRLLYNTKMREMFFTCRSISPSVVHIETIQDTIELLQNTISDKTIEYDNKLEDDKIFYGKEIYFNDGYSTIGIKLKNPRTVEKLDNKLLSKLTIMGLDYYDNTKKYKYKTDCKITMKSPECKKRCEELNFLFEYVKIKCTINFLSFTYIGELGELEILYDGTKSQGISIEWEDKTKKIAEGLYEIKRLPMFSKIPLSGNVIILMKHDSIITFQYEINTIAQVICNIVPVDERNLKKNYVKDEAAKKEEEFWEDLI